MSGVAISLVGVAALLQAVVMPAAGAANRASGVKPDLQQRPHTLYHDPGDKFSHPQGIAVDAKYVWVANVSGNSVTVLKASNGSLVHVLKGSPYDFNGPTGISDDGKHVWITNAYGNSVTELSASTLGFIAVYNNTTANFDFEHPWGIDSDGRHVWVANYGDNAITEMSATDGSLTMVIHSSPSLSLQCPSAVESNLREVWVTNYCGNSVTLFNATTLVAKVLNESTYEFSRPVALVVDGKKVWIANSLGNSVTGINATSGGSLVKVLSASSFGFSSPDAIAVGDPGTTAATARVWVANQSSTKVTGFNPNTNGGSISHVSGSAYQFTKPGGIACYGAHCWVTNYQSSTVSEFAS